MAKIITERVTAQIDGDIVVFLIGLRFNKLWKVHRWLPVLSAMPRMLRELYSDPSLGFLGANAWFGITTVMVQYWRSFEQLERYAKDRSHAHLPAWAAFNRAIGNSGDVGIWHEAYRIHPGDYECLYHNMPLFGLARATRMVPAIGVRESAEGRLRARPERPAGA